MDRLFEAYAYGSAPRAGCYWPETAEAVAVPPLEGAETADFAVIGAGFTGLTAALALARAGADVAVLDAHGPGWGASGRNGGFCCLGGAALGPTEIARIHGEPAARDYAMAERAAIDHVAEALANIPADTHSQGETYLAHSRRAAARLGARAEAYRHWYGLTPELFSASDMAGLGLGAPSYHGGMTVPAGFALNPWKYVQGLAQEALQAGVRIYGGSPVETASPGWRLTTPGGELRAPKLLVATNGYSSETVPQAMAGRYIPAQSNILVTRPLTPDEISAQGWHSTQMVYDGLNFLHYFRMLPEGRLLFGVRGGWRSGARVSERIKARARVDFERIFPAWRHVETPYFWSGLICVSRGLTPVCADLGEGVFAGFAYHGNGVAMGSYSGARLADLALGRPWTGPGQAVMGQAPRRFPLGRRRRWLLAAVQGMDRLRDLL